MSGRDAEFRLTEEVRKALHDLCQPLTALQCRLYLGTLEHQPDTLKQTVKESLVECERMMLRVRQLQEKLEEPGFRNEEQG